MLEDAHLEGVAAEADGIGWFDLDDDTPGLALQDEGELQLEVIDTDAFPIQIGNELGQPEDGIVLVAHPHRPGRVPPALQAVVLAFIHLDLGEAHALEVPVPVAAEPECRSCAVDRRQRVQVLRVGAGEELRTAQQVCGKQPRQLLLLHLVLGADP
jgi:hypothetical protein